MIYVFILSCCLQISPVRPLSEAFSSFSREQGLEDSDEAELSFDRYVGGLGEEDFIDNERRRRVTAHNRYDLAGENDEDDDDPSHSDSVHEIIQGLHNARGLLERGVETGKVQRIHLNCIR
jgi:hypothetical protein